MRTDPAYPLQKAVYETLTAYDLGTDHVWHTVPDGARLPWIVIGDDQIISDYDSGDFHECHVTVHVFAENKFMAKQLGGKVCEALDGPLTIDGFSCHEAWKESAQYFTDPDGQTGHGVLVFQYTVQPTT